MREAGDARRERALEVRVDERHLRGLVVVAVVHEVDEVQRVDVEPGEPVHHRVVGLQHLLVVEHVARDRAELRTHLRVRLLVHAAVDGVQEALREIGARAEELHLLAGVRRRDAAADRVVIAPDAAHDLVVLVLHARRRDRDLRGVALERLREARRVEDREVRLRARPHRLQRVEDAEVGLRDHAAAVAAHARDVDRRPDGIAREELVVLGNARELDHAELEDEVVDQLLRVRLGEESALQVARDEDVEERRDAPDGHRRAVLRLDRREVAEVRPLHGFARVRRRLGDVVAVARRHDLHRLQRADLLGDLLAAAHDFLGRGAAADQRQVAFLGGDQAVDAVERDAAVVADDAPAPVGVRQARDDLVLARAAHLGRVGVVDALVVRLVVLRKDAVQLGVRRVAVGRQRLLGHLDAAVGHEGALERLVGLEAHDLFEILVEVARLVRGDGRDDVGIHVEDAALGALFLLEGLELGPEGRRGLGRVCQKRLVAVIGRVVEPDEFGRVDFLLPVAARETFPGGACYAFHFL